MRSFSARLLRLIGTLLLGLSYLFTQAADVAGADYQAHFAAAVSTVSDSSANTTPPIETLGPQTPPTQAPAIPLEPQPLPTEAPAIPLEPQPLPTEAPAIPLEPQPSASEAPASPLEPQPSASEAPTIPLEPQPLPTEAPAIPLEPQPLPTEAPTSPLEPQPLPTEAPAIPPEATAERTGQLETTPIDLPNPAAGAADARPQQGTAISRSFASGDPARILSGRGHVSPQVGVAHEPTSPRSIGGERPSSSRESSRPASASRPPLAVVPDQLLGVGADSGRHGLLGFEDSAVVSASVIAVAGPQIPSAVNVAVEFGKAGHGWAGAAVFGIWLRRRLRERRMSQRQLANLSGVNHSTISRLLVGDRTPSLDTATRLARALLVANEDVGTELGFVAERPAMPIQRVEAALRGDEHLDEMDVRAIMETYIARRRRQSLKAVESSTAVLRAPESSPDPPA